VSLALYMDTHVPRAITRALRDQDVDVLTAQEDGSADIPDPDLLDRATSLSRVLFSQDKDLLREAAQRQSIGQPFGGVIYAHQRKVTVGQCIVDLLLCAQVGDREQFADRVEYLPLR
jgi:Domain of unknown function (DUF5615)